MSVSASEVKDSTLHTDRDGVLILVCMYRCTDVQMYFI